MSRFDQLAESLTEEEWQLCQWIAEGIPIAEIADRMASSVSSMKELRTGLLKKLELPNARALEHEIVQRKHPIGRSLNRPLSIFVLEDEPMICEFMVKQLNELHFVCKGATHPSDLWLLIENETPDVVVLDLQLGTENGIDVANKLRRTIQCKIVVVSARGSVDSQILGIAEAVDAFLVKPVNVSELARTIKRIHQVI